MFTDGDVAECQYGLVGNSLVSGLNALKSINNAAVSSSSGGSSAPQNMQDRFVRGVMQGVATPILKVAINGAETVVTRVVGKEALLQDNDDRDNDAEEGWDCLANSESGSEEATANDRNAQVVAELRHQLEATQEQVRESDRKLAMSEALNRNQQITIEDLIQRTEHQKNLLNTAHSTMRALEIKVATLHDAMVSSTPRSNKGPTMPELKASPYVPNSPSQADSQ